MKLSHILIGAAVALVLYKAAQNRAPAQAAKKATAGSNLGGSAGTPNAGAEWWSYAGSWQA